MVVVEEAKTSLPPPNIKADWLIVVYVGDGPTIASLAIVVGGDVGVAAATTSLTLRRRYGERKWTRLHTLQTLTGGSFERRV